jgi:hypothetical protein
MPPYLLIQYPWFPLFVVYHGLKEKIGKLKKQAVHKFQKACQARTGRNGEIQQFKRAQYLTHLPLPPYPRFPAELASILLLAFSLFA